MRRNLFACAAEGADRAPRNEERVMPPGRAPSAQTEARPETEEIDMYTVPGTLITFDEYQFGAWEDLYEHDTMGGIPKQFGWQGRNWLGFDPKRVNVYSYDTLRLPTFGQAGSTGFGLNSRWLLHPEDLTVAEMEGGAIKRAAEVPLDIRIATTVAHEMLHHVIGGTVGHFDPRGYTDSKSGEPDGVLSDEACDELLDELDIGGTDYFP